MRGLSIETMNMNLKIAIEASIEAGEAIIDIYNSNFSVEYKNDESPLTDADKKANEIINSHLRKTDIPIISEENKEIDYAKRKLWDKCWVVDPLDGTKEFIKRNGEFTVNIALINKGKPELGVIYVPDKRTLYFADVSKKQAFKKNIDFDLTDGLIDAIPIAPKKASGLLRVVGSRSHMNEETKNFISKLKKENLDKEIEIVSRGSSLKFCLLAEGEADIYPRYAPTMEWDTAAGHAICNAVGIKVESLKKNNEQLRYNKENLLNDYFLAHN